MVRVVHLQPPLSSPWWGAVLTWESKFLPLKLSLEGGLVCEGRLFTVAGAAGVMIGEEVLAALVCWGRKGGCGLVLVC